MWLIAKHSISDGVRTFFPGTSFECSDEAEARRLIECGAAVENLEGAAVTSGDSDGQGLRNGEIEPVSADSEPFDSPADPLHLEIDDITRTEIIRRLKRAKVKFDIRGRKADLFKVLQEIGTDDTDV